MLVRQFVRQAAAVVVVAVGPIAPVRLIGNGGSVRMSVITDTYQEQGQIFFRALGAPTYGLPWFTRSRRTTHADDRRQNRRASAS